MIDTNKLRRLAQAATPGPWKTGQYPHQFVIHTDVGDNGRGSDVAFTSAALGNDETVANARLIAAANPAAITELLDRLEAAEKELVEFQHGAAVANDTIKALQAKITEMEKQTPAYWGPKHAIEGGSTTVITGKFLVNPTDVPLYALPGAKGEEKWA